MTPATARPASASPAPPASPASPGQSPSANGHGGGPASEPRRATATLCPYCGHLQPGTEQCERCRGLFEPLSRQATQNVMGPWSVRNEKNPFAPGMSFEKLREMVSRGKISRTTIVRGPSTRQFWSLACNTPGVATLLGECHHCHAPVDPGAYLCAACGVVLSCSTDRQHLGLGPVKLLPGEAPAHEVASSTMSRAAERPAAPASAAAGAAHHVSTMQTHVAAAPITPAAPEPPRSLRRDRRARAKGHGAVVPVLAFIALAGLIVLVALVTGRAG